MSRWGGGKLTRTRRRARKSAALSEPDGGWGICKGSHPVCRLLDGKITFVHRRLWSALVRLSGRLPRKRLAEVREEHTPQGKHRVTERPFPRWVPKDAFKEAKELSEEAAVAATGDELVKHLSRKRTRA